MSLKACALAAALVLLPSLAAAEVRWVEVIENTVAVYKRVDSAQLTSISFYRDRQQRLHARWQTGSETFILYELADVTWARGLLKQDDWIQSDYIDDSGKPGPDSTSEQHWRWSAIKAFRFIPGSGGAATTVQMWSQGMEIGKPTGIRVSKSGAVALVRKLSGRIS